MTPECNPAKADPPTLPDSSSFVFIVRLLSRLHLKNAFLPMAATLVQMAVIDGRWGHIIRPLCAIPATNSLCRERLFT